MKRFSLIALILILSAFSSVSFADPTKPFSDPQDGDILKAAWLIGTFDVLYDWANGEITNANISPSAEILGTKIKYRTLPGNTINYGEVTELEIDSDYTASITNYIDGEDASVTALVTANTELIETEAASLTTYIDLSNADIGSLSSDLSAHIASNTNPHGTALYQDTIIATTTFFGTSTIDYSVTEYGVMTTGAVGSLTVSTRMCANLPMDGHRITGLNAGINASEATNLSQVQSLISADGVPAGAIIMWSGASSTIPLGWAICDGASGTPDLRDKFIMGASSTNAPLATGGSSSISQAFTTTDAGGTAGEIVATSSALTSVGNDANGGADFNAAAAGQVLSVTGSFTIPVHDHSVTLAFDNRPDYVALYYIIKL